MPEPTNPKKRALMPSTKLRKTLRGAGHHLSPVVQVGKEGVTEAVVRQLDEALQAHELVKVKVGTESPEDRFEAADALGGATDGQVAQILGRTILVYRRHPERPRFEPGEARPAAPREAPEARRTARRSQRGAPPRPRRTSGPPPRGGAAWSAGKTSRPPPRGAAPAKTSRPPPRGAPFGKTSRPPPRGGPFGKTSRPPSRGGPPGKTSRPPPRGGPRKTSGPPSRGAPRKPTTRRGPPRPRR